ncbi:MAG: L-threonylcarbamoyladenylate synthase [Erysipelotrichaceae bacterium]
METLRLQAHQLKQVAEILNRGGVVAFPTDTVYGLAVRSDDPVAIQRMKDAKQRPESKPFPMMVGSLSQIEAVASLGEREIRLIRRWMPGALTMIFNKKPEVSEVITNGFDTIGIRMPDDPWILELIKEMGCGLLVPSANLSGEPPASDSDEVLRQLDGRIDAVVLGRSGAQLASTIIDAREKQIKVIRQGKIRLEEILESLDESEEKR